ncbi:hypothetical protein NE237_007723 [Protea cynaroides]|uniref:Uncharacterized protein n=1 Tax=Protea cynaroides TaxID=273540 RepID=A0A9Q0QWS1_9MAGN|nr:hypothetical protein NE237_007723 [Protea cynaroides]
MQTSTSTHGTPFTSACSKITHAKLSPNHEWQENRNTILALLNPPKGANLKSILAVTKGIHEGSNEKLSFNAIAMIYPFLLENVLETYAGGGVKCLTKYCGGDAEEESSDTFSLEDLNADANGSHSWLRWRRSSGGGRGGVEGVSWAETLNGCRIGEKEGWE